MDIQGHFENVYRMVKDEPLIFILGGLLTQVLLTFSIGLLAGPVLGAYMLMMVYYLRDGRKPQFNDLFAGLSRFSELFPYFFIVLFILAGIVLFIIPGLIFLTWWLYVIALMADRRLSLGLAMRESRHKVKEKGFFLHLVFALMISLVPALIIEMLTAMIPILALLHVLVMPLQAGCIASLYLEQFEGFDPQRIKASRNWGPPPTFRQPPGDAGRPDDMPPPPPPVR